MRKECFQAIESNVDSDENQVKNSNIMTSSVVKHCSESDGKVLLAALSNQHENSVAMSLEKSEMWRGLT